MKLDEAIKHAEEEAEKNEEESKNWAYGASQINDDINRKKHYQKYAEMWHGCAEEHRQLAEWLKELKRLREQTKWIPCSKRFPKEGQRVLVTRSDGTMVIIRWYKWWYEQMQYHTIKPIAWMSSPESYKKEGADK